MSCVWRLQALLVISAEFPCAPHLPTVVWRLKVVEVWPGKGIQGSSMQVGPPDGT